MNTTIKLIYDETPTFKSVVEYLNKEIADINILSIERVGNKDVIELSFVHPNSLFLLGTRFQRSIIDIYPSRHFRTLETIS